MSQHAWSDVNIWHTLIQLPHHQKVMLLPGAVRTFACFTAMLHSFCQSQKRHFVRTADLRRECTVRLYDAVRVTIEACATV